MNILDESQIFTILLLYIFTHGLWHAVCGAQSEPHSPSSNQSGLCATILGCIVFCIVVYFK